MSNSAMRSLINTVCAQVATCGFVGYVPVMPGTITSFLTTLFFWVVPLPAGWYWGILLMLFFVGWYGASCYAAKSQRIDPSEVVIDEVVGMMLSLAFLPKRMFLYSSAFILFRFFDITKIFPINRCERLSWVGLAIMLDDVVAGVMAWWCVMGLYWIGW